MRTSKNNLRETAFLIIEECGTTGEEWLDTLKQAIQRDKSLLAEAIELAALEMRRRYENCQRRLSDENSRGIQFQPKKYKEEVIEEVNKAIKNKGLFAWIVPFTHVTLEEATREDIVNGMQKSKKLSESNGINTRFLKLIAARLQPGQIVGEVITEQELRKLKDKAEREQNLNVSW